MTWLDHFTKLLPKGAKEHLHNWHNEIPTYFPFQKPKNESLNDYFSRNKYFVFSFVRHPFDRLVSAYLDKIAGDPKHYLIERKKIQNLYGVKQIDFEIFLIYVRGKVKKYTKCKALNQKKCEFLNVHWKPYYLQCPYCDLTYNHFVGKMETFQRDVR